MISIIVLNAKVRSIFPDLFAPTLLRLPPLETLFVLSLAASLLSSSGVSSLHPDIITLPLTPDIITLVQHLRVFSLTKMSLREYIKTQIVTVNPFDVSSRVEGGESYGGPSFFSAVDSFLGGYYVDWNSVLFQLRSDSVLCRNGSARKNGSDPETGTARTVVVSLGCHGNFSRRSFDVSNSLAPNGRGSLFQFSVWRYDYPGRFARHHHVSERLACDLAKSTDRHRLCESDSAGRAAITRGRGSGATRRVDVTDEHGVFHSHAIFHGRRDALSRAGWTVTCARSFLVDHSYYHRCGRVQRVGWNPRRYQETIGLRFRRSVGGFLADGNLLSLGVRSFEMVTYQRR